MGICGSCAMIVNNKPVLACHTQIKEFETDKFIIKPLCNYAIVKDLIVDLSVLFEKHRKAMPGIIHIEKPEKNCQFITISRGVK